MAKKKTAVKKKVAKKAPAKKKTAAKKAPPKKVNKSEAIRAYFSKNEGAKPKDVVAALAKDGIEVSPQQVSTVRYSAGRTTKKRAGKSSNAVQLDSLIAASEFAEKVGGVDEAKKLLEAVAKIQK